MSPSKESRSPREIELKLELDPGAGPSFRRQAEAALGPPGERARRLTSVYFDTRKHALRRRGLALRLRQDGDRRMQTLKADGGAGAGLFERREWESPAGGERPDPDLFDDPAAVDLLRDRGRLEPIFTTTVERTAWTMAEAGSLIEIAIDEGSVDAGSSAQPIAEVEIELKGGAPADLFRVARRMAETGRIRLAPRSKSERGYALLRGAAPAGVKAEPIPLSRDMNAGEALQAIARSCLRQFQLNEGALVATREVEALHQARVAIRRLRSAFSLFAKVAADEEAGRIRAELRRLSRLLGTARNLDVFLAGPLAAEQERAPDAAGLAEFAAEVKAKREKAYDRVVRTLRSKRFRVFAVDLSAWIETGPWLQREDGAALREEPAWRFATATLDRRRRKLKKMSRALPDATPEHRHRVRIAAKKLRYASEFFATLVKGRKAKRRHHEFLRTLQGLQACLGELNDVRTGQILARRLVGSARAGDDGRFAGRVLFAVGHVTGEQDGQEAALVRAAVSARRDFTDAAPFWRR